MKNLTATLCLTIAVLLGLTGCYSLNQGDGNYLQFGSQSWKSDDEMRSHLNGEARNYCGKRPYVLQNVRVWVPNATSKIVGANVTCDPREKEKRDKFLARERERFETQKLSTFKQRCSQIGFKSSSQQHANCVLRLLELERRRDTSLPQSGTSLNDSAMRALIDEQRKAREAQQGIDMMRQGLEMMKPNRHVLIWVKLMQNVKNMKKNQIKIGQRHIKN